AEALAAAGDLDPTFGSDGLVETGVGPSNAAAWQLVRQPDGKLVVVGPANGLFAVARYEANGDLDLGFGMSGTALTSMPSGIGSAFAVALQGDGKIVVAGDRQSTSNNDAAVVRYDANGAVDTTFGDDGIVITSITNAFATAVLVQSDGKIVVGATEGFGDSRNIAVIRYDTDGSFDPSFSSLGIATVDLGSGETFGGMVLQPDGKLVVAGRRGPAQGAGTVLVARLDVDGSLDGTFGTGGAVTTAACAASEATDVARQPDGKIVVGGRCIPTLQYIGKALVARYDAAGALDGTFDGDGIATPDVPALNAIALQADGKIVGVAERGSSLNEQFAVVRIAGDGSLDATFGGNGFISTPFVGRSEGALDVAVQPDGGLVLVGTVFDPAFPGRDQVFALARYEGTAPSCSADADCDVCESCNAGACVMRPRTGCAQASAGGATLQVVQPIVDRSPAIFLWDWRGTSPPPAGLFDPVTSDDVAACIFYSGSGWRVLKATAPAAATCGPRPCWSAKGTTGWRFRGDRFGTFDGLRSAVIDSTRITVSARGEMLERSPQGVPYPGPDIPSFSFPNLLNESFVVQLHAGNGACFEAAYSNPSHESVKVTPVRSQYKATSD